MNSTPSTPVENNSHSRYSPVTNYRWVICALLFFATSINYIDRQILSLLKPILDDELHWTNEQFGMVNSVFQAAYGASLFFFGWFVDKYGTKIGYAASIAAWSVAAIGHAFVSSIGGFFGARIALGLGEGGNFPAAIKATAQWFPQKERALATTLFNSGANVGAIIAPAIVPPIAAAFGWHWAFIFAGLAGFLWLGLWFPLFDIPERSRRVSPAELLLIESDTLVSGGNANPSEGNGKMSWGAVLSYRQAWSFIMAKFLTDPIWWFFLTWLPDFFKKSRGLDIKNSAVYLITIYAIVTVLSIFGGWLNGYLVGRGMNVTRARKTSMLLFALLVLPLALVAQVGDWTAVLIIGLAGAAHQAWSATLYTTVSDMFPKRAVATLAGIGGAAGSIGGIGFPIIVGKILDKLPVGGYTLVFGYCSVTYVIAFALHHYLAPRFDRVEVSG